MTGLGEASFVVTQGAHCLCVRMGSLWQSFSVPCLGGHPHTTWGQSTSCHAGFRAGKQVPPHEPIIREGEPCFPSCSAKSTVGQVQVAGAQRKQLGAQGPAEVSAARKPSLGALPPGFVPLRLPIGSSVCLNAGFSGERVESTRAPVAQHTRGGEQKSSTPVFPSQDPACTWVGMGVRAKTQVLGSSHFPKLGVGDAGSKKGR